MAVCEGCKALRERIEKLERQLSDVGDDTGRTLLAYIQDVESECDEHNRRIERIGGAVDELEGDIGSLRGSVMELEAEKDDL
jgi:phage shock protein A